MLLINIPKDSSSSVSATIFSKETTGTSSSEYQSSISELAEYRRTSFTRKKICSALNKLSH